MGEDSCVHPVIEESFYLFLMTFPLEFDLLMIGVCTFIQKTKKQKQKQKQKDKKNITKKKTKQKKRKKKTKRKKKRVQSYVCVSYLTTSIFIFFIFVGFISGGLSEIFMRDELRESSLRSFVPCSSND